MVDQYSFSFRVLPTMMLSSPIVQPVSPGTYFKDVVGDDIKSVFVLLNGKVRIGTGSNKGRHTEETL